MSLTSLSLSIAQTINRDILGMLTKTLRFAAAGMFGDSILVPSVPLQFQPNESPAQLQREGAESDGEPGQVGSRAPRAAVDSDPCQGFQLHCVPAALMDKR